MEAGREATKFQGVYQRRSSKRRNPLDGKFDVCYDISYKKEGKKVWEKIGWKSEGYSAQIARDMRAERMQSIRHGEPVNRLIVRAKDEDDYGINRVRTFNDAWELYKEKWLPNIVRPENEVTRYTKHIAPHFSETDLRDIKPLDLETFKQKLLGQEMAPKTAHHILCLIRAIYNKLREWEIYDGPNPANSLKMPKIDNARRRYLTPDESDQLLDYLKPRSLTWWRMACLSLHTGLRLGEILGLAYGDLDMEGGCIHVRFGKIVSRMAKMNDFIKSVLAEMPPGPPSAYLFPAKDGSKRDEVDISKTFARSVKALKFNEDIADRRHKVVFHTLRHTFASWLAIDGVPLFTISKLMGHSSLDMTMRYAHLCPDVEREAVARLVNKSRPLNPVNLEF